jgi:protein phosphatase
MDPPRRKTQAPFFATKGFGATNVGCKRKANEDSFWMIPQNDLWIVADGMGGHAGGQIASTLAVQEMGKHTIALLHQAEQKTNHSVDLYQILTQAVRETNDAIAQVTELYPDLMSMGSTLTSLLIYEDTAYFAHIGDSRAYLIRDGALIQVTEDHSHVQDLVNQGKIEPEQAYTHRNRNLILKSISRHSNLYDVLPDISAVPLKAGDRFLLCSDGLIEHIRDDEILDVLLEYGSQRTPEILIGRANSIDRSSSSGFGTDNTTIVIVEVGPHRGKRYEKRIKNKK